MHIGAELQEARLRAGLTLDQIASATKIKLTTLEALEADDVEALPRAIYLNGMIRAYAAEVGVDPQPLIDQVRQSATHPEGAEAIVIPPVVPGDPGPGSRAGLAMIALLIGAMVGGGFLVASFFGERDSTRTATATDQPVPRPGELTAVAPSQDRAAAAPAFEPLPSLPDRTVGTTGTEHGASPSRDIAGEWTFETRVASSSARSFEGLRLGYQMRLEQQGDRVTGIGRKVSENGRPLAAAAQTPIEAHGTIDGNRLQLTFTEQGARRNSSGTFALTLEGPNQMRGNFSSDAARSAGSVEGKRQ